MGGLKSFIKGYGRGLVLFPNEGSIDDD